MSVSFGILSTYPPTQCGLATFTQSLAWHLSTAGSPTGVVRVLDGGERSLGMERPVSVVHEFYREALGSGAAAVAAAALANFDVAVIQHEFGIYGGADGEQVVGVIERLPCPVIVVAHTVLMAPTYHQRSVFERIIDRADVTVVLSLTAARRLIDVYHVDPDRVIVIPHGALPPGLTYPALERSEPTILTWGLLGPGKGIELAIDAMAHLRSMKPQPHYRVVGQTHPKVWARSGETYRHGLMARAIDRGVARHVSFEAAYLGVDELRRVVAEADVVVLPYESREQVTSGVLAEAVAAGKPVVATAFPHAVELLAGGGGLVVPHDDPVALANALRRVLMDLDRATAMAELAASAAGEFSWRDIAGRYRRLGSDLVGVASALAV